jgi:hypothetical protein
MAFPMVRVSSSARPNSLCHRRPGRDGGEPRGLGGAEVKEAGEAQDEKAGGGGVEGAALVGDALHAGDEDLDEFPEERDERVQLLDLGLCADEGLGVGAHLGESCPKCEPEELDGFAVDASGLGREAGYASQLGNEAVGEDG